MTIEKTVNNRLQMIWWYISAFLSVLSLLSIVESIMKFHDFIFFFIEMYRFSMSEVFYPFTFLFGVTFPSWLQDTILIWSLNALSIRALFLGKPKFNFEENMMFWFAVICGPVTIITGAFTYWFCKYAMKTNFDWNEDGAGLDAYTYASFKHVLEFTGKYLQTHVAIVCFLIFLIALNWQLILLGI